MLVHTSNHLLPQSDGAPAVLSSPSTSSYIPDIPYDDFTRPRHVQADTSTPHIYSSRRDRRTRIAPYPLSISTSAGPSQLQNQYHKAPQNCHQVPLHSPRPVAFFNTAQAFDNAAYNSNIHSSLAFSSGAHGTILGTFPTQSEPTIMRDVAMGELTATQMACFSMLSRNVPSPSSTPCASAYVGSNQSSDNGPSFAQIQMPQVPSIPRVASAHALPSRPSDFCTSDKPDGAPYLPDAIPPERSQLHIKPSGALAPPSDTFPTPVELLNELSLLDAEVIQRDRRRAERRKALLTHESEALGFTPTDPDTISTHDKKRLYLDCLEQYVVYLHNQLRLAGVEPVPVERVSSGRGLTSRSIRTMIVYLKSTTAKLHIQKAEAEIKYAELQAQLGADADSAAPFLMATMDFSYANLGTTNTSLRQLTQNERSGPKSSSSSSNGVNGSNATKMNSSGMRRHTISTSGHVDLAPQSVQNCFAEIGTGTATGASAYIQPVYPFP